MAYVYPDYKTKKAFKEAVRKRENMVVHQIKPMGGSEVIDNGTVAIEGPHYPKPHTWYAQVEMKDGRVVKIA